MVMLAGGNVVTVWSVRDRLEILSLYTSLSALSARKAIEICKNVMKEQVNE